MSEPPVVLEKAGRIAHLVLNNPPRNEMNHRFFDALAKVVAEQLPGLDADGMIVYGCSRHFSSGADIDELTAGLRGRGASRIREKLLRATMNLQALHDLQFPVVAAVRGCCFGSALELALACHHRIAAPNAVLALPESTFGLMPGCGGTIRLRQLVGIAPAIDIILTGRLLLAEQAKQIGIVDLVVERSRLLDTAEELILKLNRTGNRKNHEHPPD